MLPVTKNSQYEVICDPD